ncbi:MAG: GNAT family N-acetyltransferase [Thermoanaerobaculia bacterium]
MSEPAAYTLRAYAPGDEAAIQSAFREVFGVERGGAEWRWKFLEPPRGARILLAFDAEGELVCQYAAITVDAIWAGRPLRAAQIVDVFSRRRRSLGPRGGAFQRTLERFLAECADVGGVGFVYGFPGERHQRAGAVTGHYFDPAAVERLTRHLPLARVTASPARWTPARSWISEGFDAHATDRLWRRSRPRYPNATVRDAAWFYWRYERRPGARYVQLGVHRAGETRAWGVIDLAAGAPEARWVDLLWDGARTADLVDLAAAVEERTVASAVSAAGASSDAGGGAAVALWVRGDREARALLLERGYTGAPEPHLRLSAIAFDARVSVPQVLSGFYLTMGDSDHY